MARFQGNVHAGSDRAAATILFIVLLLVVLVVVWAQLNPASFQAFWDNVTNTVQNRP